MRSTAILIPLGIVIWVCLAAAPATQTVLTKDIVGNHRVKLVEARVDSTAAQRLQARFALVDDPKDEIVATLSFPGRTTHETTLMNIICASVDWTGPDSDPDVANRIWRKPRMTPVFSIPKDPAQIEEFERWWFVDFGSPAADRSR